MNTADIDTKLINSYLSLLENMSKQNKIDLISKLKKTVKKDTERGKTDFYNAFGSWDQSQSAEELIDSIKGARAFNREIKE